MKRAFKPSVKRRRPRSLPQPGNYTVQIVSVELVHGGVQITVKPRAGLRPYREDIDPKDAHVILPLEPK